MATNPDKWLGAVLCGGASSRMGVDKASLKRPDGRTQLEYMLGLMAEQTPHVAVSFDAERSASCFTPSLRAFDGHGRPVTPTWIADRLVGYGPIGGILAVLEHAATERFAAVAFLAIDLPAMDGATLARLVSTWRGMPEKIVVAGDSTGSLHPLVSVWPVSQLTGVARFVRGAERSLQGAIRSMPHHVLEIPQLSLLNANTPQTWHEWYDGQFPTIPSGPPASRIG